MTFGRRLVVNADDFGLSNGVNQGVIRAHTDGIVTSASLLVRHGAAEAAAELAACHPALGVGLHVDLGEWATDGAGAWRARYRVVDVRDAGAVAAELDRQLERFRLLCGRDPEHLDSHQHVHRHEPVRSIVGRRARELGVPVRHHGSVRYCGAFYGQGRDGTPCPGAVTPDALSAIIAGLPEGATELCCHPAASALPGMPYGPERVAELAALVEPGVRRAADDGGVRLCTFAQALAG